MPNLSSSWNHLQRLDELAGQTTPIHRLHPLAKLLTTLVFLVCVASYGRYEVTGLLPLLLYPVVIVTLGDLPLTDLLKRMLLAAPFALGVGIMNPVFDRTPFMVLGDFTISGGWVSFVSILLRFTLTVLVALCLIATTGILGVGRALLLLRVPRVFVTQLLLLYRYLSVLMEEAGRTLRAHSFRSLSDKGLGFRVWGSLVGQLLLRTIARAERIYQAMRCRGFDGEIRTATGRSLTWGDILTVVFWSGFFIFVRFYNLPEILGAIMTGVNR